jgi:RNA-binding protein
MTPPLLTSAEKRKLKSEAQLLEPVVRVGKGGLTPTVLASIEQALTARKLIKVRFDHERDERDVLAQQVAEATNSELIWQIGKVAVYYRNTTGTSAETTSPTDSTPRSSEAPA